MRRHFQRMEATQSVVDEQAEDDGLWFASQTASEAYLQQALRRLHATIEGEAGMLALLQKGAGCARGGRLTVGLCGGGCGARLGCRIRRRGLRQGPRPSRPQQAGCRSAGLSSSGAGLAEEHAELLTDASVRLVVRRFVAALQDVVAHGYGSVTVEVAEGKVRLVQTSKSELVRDEVVRRMRVG